MEFSVTWSAPCTCDPMYTSWVQNKESNCDMSHVIRKYYPIKYNSKTNTKELFTFLHFLIPQNFQFIINKCPFHVAMDVRYRSLLGMFIINRLPYFTFIFLISALVSFAEFRIFFQSSGLLLFMAVLSPYLWSNTTFNFSCSPWPAHFHVWVFSCLKGMYITCKLCIHSLKVTHCLLTLVAF